MSTSLPHAGTSAGVAGDHLLGRTRRSSQLSPQRSAANGPALWNCSTFGQALEDVAAALTEARRVLDDRGRAVVLDTDC
jgi:hypothetical protein